MKKVAMIGVGKLGQDCAEVMADAGYDVVGYDIEPRTPAFPMRSSIQEAVSDRDIIFIAAPTPHDPIYGGETPTSHLPNKDFDYTIVKNILNEVNKHVNKTQLVVLISTVLPGTVRNQLEPCITNARFIYNPYLIAMGTIKWDMVNPEMVIIGTEDGSVTGDAQELIEFYKVFMQNDPRYEVGTWDEAESIKIFYNTFISTKLALVNMIQDVAETNGNINVDVVTNALKKSTYRIMGPAYMTAAFGDAGACHPRDNIALRWLADRLELGYDLFDAIMTAREVQAERMALRCLKNGRNVTIIGKAYKPCVPYTNGSASMLVGYYIEKHGGNLNYYDPNTGDHDMRENWTQVYLIGYWEPFVENIRFKDPGAVVIDPWRKINPKQHSGEIIYYGDTRPKHKYAVPESTVSAMRQQILTVFPNLKPYMDEIHVIDATINFETTFILRPTEDVVKEIIEEKQKGKSKFVFFAVTEAFMPHVLSKIQRLAIILDGVIDEKDFIFLTALPDAVQVYNKIHQEHIWTKHLTIWGCAFFDYIAKCYAADFEFIGGYDVRHRGKIFTCFNKLNREHRLVLLNKLLSHGVVDRAYYSFEGDERFKTSIPALNPIKYSNIISNQEMFPLRLNMREERRHNPVNIEQDDLIYYKDSYFSVVTETLFYSKSVQGQHHKPLVEDSMFLTEKTYRCFAMLHPFVLLARPYALKELRRQGFKTFSPFINESYDNIENDDLRMEAIVKEIVRLSNLSGADWQVWQEGIKDIVHYNHEYIHGLRDYVFTKNYMDVFKDGPREQYIEPPVVEVFEQPQLEESVPAETNLASEFQSDNTALDWRPKTLQLDGIKISFPTHIDGGGSDLLDELDSLISRSGKEKYHCALDWCAGYGPFGFSLLAKNKVEKAVFTDIYDVATQSVKVIAKENNLEDKVVTITTDKISSISLDEKFDLVVANPPHCNSKAHVSDDNTARIIVDENFAAHRDFYSNIRRFLTDDADIYITAGSNSPTFVHWAKQGGLKYMGFAPSSTLRDGGIYHFKVES